MRRVILSWVWLCAVGPAALGSEVVSVHDPHAVSRFQADGPRVARMLERGLQALRHTNDAVAAWRHFCTPQDVVGIKINSQGAPLHGTHRELVDAIITGLRQAGVAATNIWVFDRDLAKMQARGFAGPGDTQQVPIVGPTDFDAAVYYDNRIAGRLIWGDRLFGEPGQELSTRSHLPRLLTQRLTTLINVPALQDHETTGLSGCLYNLSLSLVDNTRRFEGYEGRSDAAIAEICAMPAVRNKVVLHILDALVGGFAGGPGFKPQYGWHCGRLYLSTDPVAVDSLALEQIEARRQQAQVPAIGPRAGHVAVAARLGLGQNQRARIRLRELASSDDPGKDQQK